MYLLVFTVVVATVLASEIIYNVFLSPLRAIPGPFLAKITPRWLMLIDLAGNRTSTLHRLHQKYGSSVRIGPREISYSNTSMVKEIYGQQSPYMKAPIYDSFSMPPVGIFSMRDKADHSQRRRLLSHAFSQSSLYNTEPLIKEQIQKLLALLHQGVGQPFDVLAAFRKTAFDIVGELFLGRSFGALDSPESPEFLIDMDYLFINSGLMNSFPWLHKLLTYVPLPALRHFLKARERLYKYASRAFDDYIFQNGRESQRGDLLSKFLVSKDKDRVLPTDLEISSEIGNLVFAGTDTTSTTLTYLFWELAKFPEHQTRLRSELSQKIGTTDIPLYKDLADLPFLDAVVNEALRLHPAAPASLQRVIPAGGQTLNGVFIPEKTVISMQCYTTQRDAGAFPNPDAFVPERWIGPDAVSNEMKALFMPFSQGPRACLGKNLAMMELKIITTALILKYEVHLARGTTDDSMAMTDHFLAIPKGGKCDLTFTLAEGGC